MTHGCVFGVLPQGTFNDFGRTPGIPEDLADAVRALLVPEEGTGQAAGAAAAAAAC